MVGLLNGYSCSISSRVIVYGLRFTFHCINIRAPLDFARFISVTRRFDKSLGLFGDLLQRLLGLDGWLACH